MNVVPRKTSGYLLALAGLCAAVGAAAAGPQRLLYQPPGGDEGALSSGATPWALTWLEQKTWAADGASRDYLGSSFVMAGDTALAGAPYARGSAGNYQGAAYVFARADDGTWAQAQKLTASDAIVNAYFGNSVALQGDTALIGADGTGSAVYVFARGTDGVWTQTQKLVPSDGVASFGARLALDGDVALVGAASATVGGNSQQGKVYVFRRSADGAWSETQQLVADDGAAWLYFGNSLVLKDGAALIGASGAAVDGQASRGAVYAFAETRDDGFVQTQRFSSSDGESYHPFGNAIALSGARALIAASGATIDGIEGAGAVYLFTRTDAGWSQVQKLTASDPAAYASFGQSVALLGPTAVIGSSGAVIGGNINQGATYVFTDTNGTWTQTDKLVAGDGAPANYFGWQVTFDGTTLGSAANSAAIDGVALRGALYFYERSGGEPHVVTPGVLAGSGSIAPDVPQTVDDTATAAFTLTPDAGYRIAGVGGNCDGTLQGDVFITAPITADCNVEVRFELLAQTVTPGVEGGHGTISPDTPQTVDYGDTLSFTLTPDADYLPDVVGGSCGGTLDGTTFTTAPITADCSVVARFRPAQHTVTPGVSGGHGAISPDTPQTVADGASAVFTLMPEPGYAPTVAGSCGGALDGDTYTTEPVVADCSVEVSYSPARYTVTPRLLTGHGTIAPGLPQNTGYGEVLTFTLTPDAGYVAAVTGSCGGTLDGDVYTTAPIAASCTVEASFAEAPDTIFSNGFD